jgi:hypothetical protein
MKNCRYPVASRIGRIFIEVFAYRELSILLAFALVMPMITTSLLVYRDTAIKRFIAAFTDI